MKNCLIFISFLFLQSCNAQNISTSMDYSTIQNIEIEKYMGTWFEIARFDHSFERNLVGVTASYTFLANGKVKVVNSGYKNTLNGKFKSTTAKAKVKEAGKLKVFFVPFFGADYFILELDKDYQWALVGSSSPNYLWILSRNSNMNENTLNQIILLASKRGYDTSKLLFVEHIKE